MFSVIILICSIGVAPRDCGLENARDVIDGPEAQNEITCMMQSQAYVAGTALSFEGSYVKVLCRRTAIGTASVG